jgi:predicted metal-dependent peptidase
MEHLDESVVRQLYADPAGAGRQARDKVAAARVWLMKHKPFFGVLARALRVEPTLQVAGLRLHVDDRVQVNPVVVLSMRFPTLCARLAHVSMHAALAAFGRRRGREARRWNVAHDLAIAPLLDSAELSLGTIATAGGSMQELAPGASAEAYYAALPEGIAPDALWCDLCDPLAEQELPPAGTFTRQDDGGGDDEGDPSDGDGTDGDEGAGDELDELDDAGVDVASAEARSRELQWKMRLGAALEEELASGGKTFGELPAWIDELVRATIEPPADWTVALQQSMSSLQRGARTYLRPSRRMAALVGGDDAWPDVVSMPGRRVQSAGQLAAVIDTSASIDADTLARFLGAVASVATAEGIDELRLLQADVAITRDETLHSAELLFYEVAMVGRGGTDFAPALLALAAESKRSGERFTVVYLTDLDGRFPEPDDVKHLDVLWVVPVRSIAAPPFGRLAEMVERDLGGGRF